MTATRTQKEIEQDVANIDRALLTVSELRSSLRQFVRTVKSNPKNPSYINQFGEGLQKIKRDLSRQAVEGEHLKGALEYAQQVAQENDFNWPAIQEFMADEASIEQHIDTETRTKQETGNLVKGQVDYLFSELSSVVLQKHHTDVSEVDIPVDFITKNFDQWMTSGKNRHHIMGKFLQPEQRITTGSACCLEISVAKVMVATLDLEYHHATNSLIIHRYEIKGPKEDKPFWQESKYKVFQKINMIAAKAFEEMTVLSAREALLKSLNWLSDYHHLFSEPCHSCHKRLQFDSPQYKHLPPVIRTWSHDKDNNTASNTSTSSSSSSSPPPLSTINNESSASDRPALGLPYHLRCYTGHRSQWIV